MIGAQLITSSLIFIILDPLHNSVQVDMLLYSDTSGSKSTFLSSHSFLVEKQQVLIL
jgi:hypothetical protein